jgi:signal transduction histidine kinase
LNKAAIFAVLIAGFAALILAMVLSYSLAHPVRTLQNAASHLAAGDLSHRVQIQGQDEFANLGRTFNHMAESLQNAEESRRNMTADIAHELRNPLAVQRAHLEAIEDGVYPLTTESLTIIEEQNILLTRLVEDLRTIALADAGKLELERSRVDLVLLARQVATRFDVQAAEKAIFIHLSLEACPPISVDPQRIEQILHNLFSNALRFTPEGGEIHCFLWSDGSVPEGALSVNGTKSLKPHKNCYLQIKDSGPGIPPDSLPYIFDRFYRVDKSRTRSDGGTGLGLSIARKLAQAHNGALTADNHPQGGALFTLSLPYEVDP